MTVDLSKGQRISLTKSGGGELTVVRMGLGWKSAPRKGFLARLTAREIDLDASAILFAGTQPQDVVFFQHLTSDDGSVRHTGDNLVGGAGDGGDDESIIVDLQRVPAQIMAKVARAEAGWQMTAIGAATHGRTFQDLLPVVAGHL